MRRDDAHQAAFARIDEALAVASNGGVPIWVQPAVEAVAFSRDLLDDRVKDVLGETGDEAEARAGLLTAFMTRTVSGALLLEEAADDPHKGLVALRYARRQLIPDTLWDDQIAAKAGRELLAFAELDDSFAQHAAA